MLPRVFFNSSLLFSPEQHSKEISCGAQPVSDTRHCVTAHRSHLRHGVVAVVHRAGHRSGTESARAGNQDGFSISNCNSFYLIRAFRKPQLVFTSNISIIYFHLIIFKYIFQITLAEVGLERCIIFSLSVVQRLLAQ